jgi:MFS family permease
MSVLIEAFSRKRPVWRILGVTALVSILGGLAGAALGMLVMAVIATVDRGWDFWMALEWATVIGLAIGGFLAPIMTWLFLRRVPLWRASLETAFAATIGFAASALLNVAVPLAVATTLTCSLLAAVRLKRAYRPKQEVLEA